MWAIKIKRNHPKLVFLLPLSTYIYIYIFLLNKQFNRTRRPGECRAACISTGTWTCTRGRRTPTPAPPRSGCTRTADAPGCRRTHGNGGRNPTAGLGSAARADCDGKHNYVFHLSNEVAIYATVVKIWIFNHIWRLSETLQFYTETSNSLNLVKIFKKSEWTDTSFLFMAATTALTREGKAVRGYRESAGGAVEPPQSHPETHPIILHMTTVEPCLIILTHDNCGTMSYNPHTWQRWNHVL